MMKHVLTLAAAVLFVPFPMLRGAGLKLHGVLGDHMVLQRDKPVPVWGWATPGEHDLVADRPSPR